MKLSVDIEIKKAKHDVWLAITDIENSAQMITGILDLTVINKPESGVVGLKWQETRKVFGKESSETMWITDAEVDGYYCTRAENCGAIYVTKFTLTQQGDGTLLTMSFSGGSDSFFLNLMSKLMGMFIKKSMKKLLQQDLQDIKSFVEAH